MITFDKNYVDTLESYIFIIIGYFGLTYIIDIRTKTMKGLVVRHRKSGYTKTILPFDEDREYWYVTEIQDKTIVETLRYSKREFDFMGEK